MPFLWNLLCDGNDVELPNIWSVVCWREEKRAKGGEMEIRRELKAVCMGRVHTRGCISEITCFCQEKN